jgi:hypothetical protein
MSTFRPYTVQCACGHSFQAQLAVAVNAVRMPKLRQEILDGTLHRVTCPSCGRNFTAHKRFVYVDLERDLVVDVHPPSQAPRWRDTSARLNEELDSLDRHGVLGERIGRRVAFGIGELREKLVAQDAEVDDRHVELAKVLALHEHPVLLRRPRLRLFLDRMAEDRVHFFAGYDHAQQTFRVALPRFAFDRLAEGAGEKWSKSTLREDSFRHPDQSWVSVRRLVPENGALATLHSAAETLRAGHSLDLNAAGFIQMIGNLPRGSHLPTAAKVDLRDIEKYARDQGRSDIQDKLFEVRFGVELDDEWGQGRDTAGIDTLWDLLKDLPDTNVEGNTQLHEIFLRAGAGGGVFNPSSDDVEVTTPPNAEKFASVMRHEIGHAVQDMLDTDRHGLVTALLRERFGWTIFPGTTKGADAWVRDMGGWGQIGSSERRRICDALVMSLGPGSQWKPPPAVSLPQSPAWGNPDFGPRSAVDGSLENWFSSNSQWHKANGRRYFLNYWYRAFMAVDEASIEFVNSSMPWNYAAMSPGEFFAELYALYYDLDDPRRASINAGVAAWLDQHVGAPRRAAPMPPGGGG